MLLALKLPLLEQSPLNPLFAVNFTFTGALSVVLVFTSTSLRYVYAVLSLASCFMCKASGEFRNILHTCLLCAGFHQYRIYREINSEIIRNAENCREQPGWLFNVLLEYTPITSD